MVRCKSSMSADLQTRTGAAAQAVLVVALAFFLGSCGMWGGSGSGSSLNPWGSKRPKVALVLGGGAARGFAHVGVIRALERGKIPIDLIVGVNSGSLIGAIYAD